MIGAVRMGFGLLTVSTLITVTVTTSVTVATVVVMAGLVTWDYVSM